MQMIYIDHIIGSTILPHLTKVILQTKYNRVMI